MKTTGTRFVGRYRMLAAYRLFCRSLCCLLCCVLASLAWVGKACSATNQAPTSAAHQEKCPWMASKAPIAQRVDQLLAKMTLAQKIHELHGIGEDAYSGTVPPIPALCIPSLTFANGPGGVGSGMQHVTQLPAPVALAASWNTALALRYGKVVGAESRGKGVKVNLGPTINIVRDPRWGRAFEAYSEDPYLTGEIGAAYVLGVQGTGTMAEIKHFAVYNQETNRNLPADNVIIGPRALHEIYLRAFATIIKKAHPASLMCGYNYINGVTGCQNPLLLSSILRDQFGYRGFIVSDWHATHSTVASTKAGLNIEMPRGKYYGAALKEAVKSGAVPVSVVDDLVRPILAEMFRFHLFTRSSEGTPHAVVTTPWHTRVARRVAEQSAVLLKNHEHILPLSASKVRSIAVIGTGGGAGALTVGGGSARVNATTTVTPYQGIVARAGNHVCVRYAQGNLPLGEPPVVPATYLAPTDGDGHGFTVKLYANETLSGKPAAVRQMPNLDFNLNGDHPSKGMPRNHWSARWTATLMPPVTGDYTFQLTSDDGARLFIDGKRVIDNWQSHGNITKSATVSLVHGHAVNIEVDYYQADGDAFARLGWRVPGTSTLLQQNLLQQAVDLAASSDVAVIFAGDFESEGSDLGDIDLPGDQNRLIAAVAKANPNTIVVLNTGSAVTMPWLGAVKGVIEDWYPGQEDGHAIAAVLFGDVNPSGKLPVTFPRRLTDVPAAKLARWPGLNGKIKYSEGLNVGYRWYAAKGITPSFAFGSGLSYTTFAFSRLKVTPRAAPGAGVIDVAVDVSNTGKRQGAEVVQLYVGEPKSAGEPPKQLEGFKRIVLVPGQTRTVHFRLPVRALAIWNVKGHAWKVVDGTYRIMVGSSSVDLPQRASVRVSHGMAFRIDAR